MKRQVFIIFLLIFLASPTLAYKTDTHQLISARAVTSSSNYQKFLNEFSLQRNRADGLILYGSIAEDDASLLLRRYQYHFYDPINEKGLFEIFDPAPVWGYSHTVPFNEFSWVEARQALYDWLTGETEGSREESYKKVFRSLGHVIHLIQDMAQPSHVRGDAHASHSEDPTGIFPTVFNPSHLEDWGQDHSSEIFSYANTATGPKSVVSFDDTFETLALFSNQNFFSDDTIFKDYELPSKEETNYTDAFLHTGIGGAAQVVAEDGQIDYVPYIIKTSGTITGYKLAQVGYFGPVLVRSADVGKHLLAFQIDDEVAKDNAKLLIPQAVGYSAGLLDYFFRGEVEAENEFAGVRITNKSGETMNGNVEFYYDAVDPETGAESRKKAAGPLPTGSLGSQGSTVLQPILVTTNAKDPGQFILVFRGALGAEPDAVVGKVVELPNHAFVIQDTLALNSTEPFEESIDSTTGLDEYNFTRVEGTRKLWSTYNQILTGRFATYGPIRQIKAVGSVLKFSINNMDLPNYFWNPTMTPDPPSVWRMEATRGPVSIEILLADNRVIRQDLFNLDEVSSTRYKSYSQRECLEGPYMICNVSKYESVSDILDWESGAYNTVRFFSMGNESLSIGSLLIPQSSEFSAVPFLSGSPYVSFRRELVNFYDGNNFSYREFSWIMIEVDGNLARSFDVGGEADPPSNLTIPDYLPLTISGQINRIYSQAELDYLNKLGIEPVQYSIILSE
jgi:hypothetical protein